MDPFQLQEIGGERVIGDLAIDLRPQRVSGLHVGHRHVGGVRHLGFDGTVAEAGDVDRGVRPGMKRVAAVQDAQIVRRRGIIGDPVSQADLDVVVGVLLVGELDVEVERANAGVKAELVEDALDVDAHRAAEAVVGHDQVDLGAGGAAVGDEGFGECEVGCVPAR